MSGRSRDRATQEGGHIIAEARTLGRAPRRRPCPCGRRGARPGSAGAPEPQRRLRAQRPLKRGPVRTLRERPPRPARFRVSTRGGCGCGAAFRPVQRRRRRQVQARSLRPARRPLRQRAPTGCGVRPGCAGASRPARPARAPCVRRVRGPCGRRGAEPPEANAGPVDVQGQLFRLHLDQLQHLVQRLSSAGVTIMKVWPVLPARPVRPMRWT